MAWPWAFLKLSSAEKQERRLVLDRYGAYAHLSTFLPIVVFVIYRFMRWVVTRANSSVDYQSVPTSPAAKRRRLSATGAVATATRRIVWWLADDVELAGRSWGRRDQLVFGAAWTLWLLCLCMAETGSDYFHLSKRFGAIAASQLPMQYILALKYVNPVAYAFHSSHEEINRWHRVLGRIIYGLLCVHGLLYLNWWFQSSSLLKAFGWTGSTGMLALLSMTLLNTTSFAAIRHYSYRVFFITHVCVAFALPPIVFFHVHHARLFMAEALAVFVVDLAVRKLDTVMAAATVNLVPGTSLIKIVAQVPQRKSAQFRSHPGSHLYMNIPAAARLDPSSKSWSHLIHELIFNPFTVASVDDAGNLLLVARRHSGPMTKTLAAHASRGPDVKIPLSIEGPFGVSSHLKALAGAEFDRILLFAGGVGATYILPIYQHILREDPYAKAELVWAVREPGDATWPAATGEDTNVLDDEKISIYLTGSMFDPGAQGGSDAVDANANGNGDGDGGVEMSTFSKKDGEKPASSHVDYHRRRPDLQQIVDEAFRHGLEERIAILVCGPDGMARELRRCVAPWVKKGRSVWWHNESFAW